MAANIKVLTVTFDVPDTAIITFLSHTPPPPSISACPSKENDYSTLVGPLLSLYSVT